MYPGGSQFENHVLYLFSARGSLLSLRIWYVVIITTFTNVIIRRSSITTTVSVVDIFFCFCYHCHTTAHVIHIVIVLVVTVVVCIRGFAIVSVYSPLSFFWSWLSLQVSYCCCRCDVWEYQN